MKDRKLVETNRIGQTIFYSIISEQLQLLRPFFKHITDQNLKKELV